MNTKPEIYVVADLLGQLAKLNRLSDHLYKLEIGIPDIEETTTVLADAILDLLKFPDDDYNLETDDGFCRDYLHEKLWDFKDEERINEILEELQGDLIEILKVLGEIK